MSTAAAPSNRYIRQEILGVVGAAGQERLARAHAALIGAGALGSTIADLLVRAGIGVDRVTPRRRLEDAFLALVGDSTRGSGDR